MSIKHNFEMQAFKIGAVVGKTIFSQILNEATSTWMLGFFFFHLKIKIGVLPVSHKKEKNRGKSYYRTIFLK
jgi:hypothetical protein